MYIVKWIFSNIWKLLVPFPEAASTSISNNQSLAENRTDLSSQTSMDHGLHNPLVYVSSLLKLLLLFVNNYVNFS